MLKTLLQSAAIPARSARYPDPPAETYAVYFDEETVDGPDIPDAESPLVIWHDCMVELYEPIQDDAKETAFEAALRAHGLLWTKRERHWLKDVQRYQTIYEFTYYEKRRA